MTRIDISETIGSSYRTVNIEGQDEFSYVQAGIPLVEVPKINNIQSYKLDMRFEKHTANLSILVETLNINSSKKDWDTHEQKLLNGYLKLEEKLRPNNNIILILTEIGINAKTKIWKKKKNVDLCLLIDTKIKNLKEYETYFEHIYVNDEIKIKESVLKLNELLHKNGIEEKIRGQFVGTCLLALKSNDINNNSFIYQGLNTNLIIAGIKNIINNLLKNDVNKIIKIDLLDTKILNNQKIRTLKSEKIIKIIDFIKNKIVPYINPKTNKGQDLLNLFFTTFNKYVGKTDKNQAFTPDHITHFMCKVAEINKNSKVLDPTCGSGSFIVQALIQELNECNSEEEKQNVKKNNIYGIETEEKAYGLSITNMLIHENENSNIILDEEYGCFNLRNWIQKQNINVVLMNPPYNAKPVDIPKNIQENDKIIYTIHNSNWTLKQEDGKSDPSKGFCFVNYIADCIGKNIDGSTRQGSKLLCLLPLACAIGNKKQIVFEKERILQNNTLDAVFTLPPEMFYPGANVNACCMVFTIGIPHYTIYEENGICVTKPRKETFLGYFKDDGFYKKKNLGRISKLDNQGKQLWESIEKKWLDLYFGNIIDSHIAIKKKLTSSDEWLAESYLETDYESFLSSNENFETTIRQYLAFLITRGHNFTILQQNNNQPLNIKQHQFDYFVMNEIFDIQLPKGDIKIGECSVGNIPLISSGSLNNGVVEYIDDTGDGVAQIFDENQLTVNMFCQAFYQPYKFFAVSHGCVNILKPKYNLFNKYHGLFIATIISNEKYRFSYNRACYSNAISFLKIKLPSKTNKDNLKVIDWDFIESFIKSLNYANLI